MALALCAGVILERAVLQVQCPDQDGPREGQGLFSWATQGVCLPPQIPPRWLTLLSWAKERPPGGNLLTLCVSLVTETDWVYDVTSLSWGMWEGCGPWERNIQSNYLFFKVKLLLLPERSDQQVLFPPAIPTGMWCCFCVLSRVQLFATPWTIAHQASLSMGFSRQEYWCRVPFSPSGDLPDPGIEPRSLAAPALAGGFFFFLATEPPGKPLHACVTWV